MSQRGRDAREPAAPQHVMRGKRGEHGQRPNLARELGWNLGKQRPSFAQQELAGLRIAAVACAVHERPERACSLGMLWLCAEHSGADAEENSTAQAQPLFLRLAPRERLQQRKPRVFELRQFLAADASAQQLPRDCAEARLSGWRYSGVERFQLLAPPREANGSKRRFGGRRCDVRQRKVEVPECRECQPDGARNGGQRRQPVGIERALSDR